METHQPPLGTFSRGNNVRKKELLEFSNWCQSKRFTSYLFYCGNTVYDFIQPAPVIYSTHQLSFILLTTACKQHLLIDVQYAIFFKSVKKETTKKCKVWKEINVLYLSASYYICQCDSVWFQFKYILKIKSPYIHMVK